MTTIKVVELFAGVGGFRIGLERADKSLFKTIWSNQWEPATTTQHAWRTYNRAFKKLDPDFDESTNINEDISKVSVDDIPNHNMLVGGFPCQDYSVARTLSQAAGIVGKKGVLWWDIHRIIKEKGNKSAQILFLENVDRLLQSPASQRGRDFAIILQSLSDLGYIVEWRVINAAEYGMPQRRRRTYILAYKKGSKIEKSFKNPTDWLYHSGVFAKAFPIQAPEIETPLIGTPIKSDIDNDLVDVSESFNKRNKARIFETAGVMVDGVFYTTRVIPAYFGHYTTLGDILVKGEDRKYLTENFYLSDAELPRWEYLKGAKHEARKRSDGEIFYYNEGGMDFPDPLDKPSRTIITSEGGKSASRTTHVIKDPVDGRFRRLLPIELERLDMFPDNHTEGETDGKRAFFMGNALVCGIIQGVGEELAKRLK